VATGLQLGATKQVFGLFIASSVFDTFFTRLNIEVVQNLRHELLLDAFVAVNQESNVCSPLTQNCLGNHVTIDSVKIIFENGCSSTWLQVEKREFDTILPVLQLDFPMSRYWGFSNKRFRFDKGTLIEME
jgi:hypothetical protein